MAEKRKELMSNYDYIRQVTAHYIPGLLNPENLNPRHIKHELFNHELLIIESLTSEATPSTIQFFKRSYKISHLPQL